MNAYLLTCPYDLTMYTHLDDELSVPERYRPWDLYFAKTRGQAKAWFLREHDLDWTNAILCRQIATNVSRARGEARLDDRYWLEVNWEWDAEFKSLIPATYDEETPDYILAEYHDYPEE